ncbi:MAG: hypothetical protein IPK59_14005 [Rhodospirillaceae bacterium]|nr:hypothetical protein [Rhodospirillaceae bacterium]
MAFHALGDPGFAIEVRAGHRHVVVGIGPDDFFESVPDRVAQGFARALVYEGVVAENDAVIPVEQAETVFHDVDRGPELLFEAHERRDVRVDSDDALDLAVGGADRHRPRLHMDGAAILVPVGLHELDGGALAGKEFLILLACRRDVFRRDDLEPEGLEILHVGGGVAEHFGVARGGPVLAGAQIAIPDPVLGAGGGEGEAVIAGDEGGVHVRGDLGGAFLLRQKGGDQRREQGREHDDAGAEQDRLAMAQGEEAGGSLPGQVENRDRRAAMSWFFQR